ncbi:MAG: hypothetical protein WA885_06205 [Phormidesmis sp.]
MLLQQKGKNTQVPDILSKKLACQTVKIRASFWLLGMLIAAIQAIRYRYELSSNDIIPYLDIADAYLAGDWGNAINGNWSPLYSWILAFFSLLFRPSEAWEFPFVKLANFLVFIFVFASFNFFLKQFLFYYEQISLRSFRPFFIIPHWVWLCLGYSLFLLSSLKWIGVYCDTPDLANAGIIYLATGLILKIYRHPKAWSNFIALGGILALGYFSKAAMFPLGFVFLLASLFATGSPRKIWPKTLVALIVFLLICSPYISVLSLKKGSLTFSETGKLSYVWYVYPTMSVIPDTLWQGEHPEFGTPQNPIRKIFENPDILEFGEPIDGTYPLWMDPSYWYEGIIANFNLKTSLKLLALNIQFYWKMFLGVLVFSYLTFVVWSGRFKSILSSIVSSGHLLILSLSGLAIYALSTNLPVNNYQNQPSSRFFSAFITLLCFGLYSTLRLPNLKSTRRIITSLTLVTCLFIFVQLGTSTARSALAIAFKQQNNIHWQIATEMKQRGLKPGDNIAFFGNENQRSNHIYWARLADVKIIAQLEKPDTFWGKAEPVQASALKALQAAGVKAVVEVQLPLEVNADSQLGWQQLGNTQYYAYFFPTAD